MNLRMSGNKGIDAFPDCGASSPPLCNPDNLRVSALERDDAISVQAGPDYDGFHGNPISKALPIDTVERLPGPVIFARGSKVMNTATVPSSPMPHTAVATPSTKRPRILVVDDESLYTELIADTLGADYEILPATEGMAALEIAAIKVPHLILLDVMMPGIDGYEVYRRLKADHRTNEIPVIFISGLGDVAAETRGLELGAVD
jgi:CheY-like chemotaxis protein